MTRGIQRCFKTIQGKPGDKWILQTRRTWEGGVYYRYFKLVPIFEGGQELLFWWSLYPIEDTHMKRLIELAGLQYIDLPVQISVSKRQDTEIYVCRRSGRQ